ncbi:MAG: S8 family peptidase [Candidatus Eisenbacteria bacterium]|uniref:S8 family peptidase n=1 Tax=Eiseniibacteriota bacterium TaxID=2212470 RepID=A0A948RYI2_UNCEI|nr:S8 family peptidase [Candidatus Eisenbacteria bacterium]MBU1947188.1 S8 family peptidase [Candidatus Eisenbacteria bacterium]MBU2693363.1 S8 family peptidase [Candidatus Eisenbacteria bacterium]
MRRLINSRVFTPDRRFCGNFRVAALFAAALLSAAVIVKGEYDPGFIQVQLADGYSIESVNACYGTATRDSLPPLYLLTIPEGCDEQLLITDMAADSARFVCVEHAYREETPEGVRQMIVAAVGGTIDQYWDQNVVERLHLPLIQGTAQGDGILVAVLDTGVLATHEALAGAIAPGGYDFIDNDAEPLDEANGIDDDLDGQIDEGSGHGTLVAGVIHLAAPGAQILPVRVLDDEGRGTTFALAKGIRYAVEQGADIINMSLGLPEHSGVVAHELAQASLASVGMVSAVGNLGVDSVQYYPASDFRVLMVAALDSMDVKADFSSYHAKVALSAPGVGIMGPYYDGAYALGAGTSFSAAFISGQCALILDLLPSISADELYKIVEQGTIGIYHITENQLYINRLGTGCFDGRETLRAIGILADVGPFDAEPWPIITPNPVMAGETVYLALPDEAAGQGWVPAVALYDIAGRRLHRFAPQPRQSVIAWDGSDRRGMRLAPGVYYLRVSGPRGAAWTNRVVVLSR